MPGKFGRPTPGVEQVQVFHVDGVQNLQDWPARISNQITASNAVVAHLQLPQVERADDREPAQSQGDQTCPEVQ